MYTIENQEVLDRVISEIKQSIGFMDGINVEDIEVEDGEVIYVTVDIEMCATDLDEFSYNLSSELSNNDITLAAADHDSEGAIIKLLVV